MYGLQGQRGLARSGSHGGMISAARRLESREPRAPFQAFSTEAVRAPQRGIPVLIAFRGITPIVGGGAVRRARIMVKSSKSRNFVAPALMAEQQRGRIDGLDRLDSKTFSPQALGGALEPKSPLSMSTRLRRGEARRAGGLSWP